MAPRFSIIVPTHNRADLLDRCLTAIGGLENDRSEFEVLVVDDGSTPPPLEVLARHAALLPLVSFRTEGVGPAGARNLALRHATGDYVVFTDDDCRPHPQWLNGFAAAAGQWPGGGFGGKIVDAPENGLCGRTSQMIVSFLYDYAERSKGLKFFCSNNLAFPRRALVELGGFDESFPLAAAEDRFLCARWLTQGSLHFVPAAVIEHRQRLTLRGFLRQHYRYGVGAVHYWRRLEAEGGPRNEFEAGNFYSSFVMYPWGKVGWGQALPMSMLIIASQAALALGYYAERFTAATPSEPHDRRAGEKEPSR
jgi:glycosyltransferase involved in cell wall biosynthesis